MDIDYPYQFDAQGRTAAAATDDHVRDMIEQVLFTAPGERVNRPDFGCGLPQLVFAPNSDELSSALEFLIRGSLQKWLGEVITVEALQVVNEDAVLRVTLQYSVRRTQERRVDQFTRSAVL
jgi:phage baseplate assembly protein W